MPEISIIAAVSENYAIGKLKRMPWHLPADLKHFKELTTGHAIIMGKRTYEYLPVRPLPNRKNIVLTTILSEGIIEGYFEVESIDAALELCEHEKQIFVIGGEAVYHQFIDKADSLYITWVHETFDADAHFPEINFNVWKEVSRQDFPADENNPYPFSFVEYRKN